MMARNMIETSLHDGPPGPVMIMVSASTDNAHDVRHLAARAGVRLAAVVTPENAMERFGQQIVLDGVWIDWTAGVTAERLAPTLAYLKGLSEHQVTRMVVATSLEYLDDVMPVVPLDTALLCDASDADRLGALVNLGGPDHHRLHDIGADRNVEQLSRLNDEVQRIARLLSSMSREQVTGAQPQAMIINHQDAMINETVEGSVDGPAIRMMLRVRRMRNQFFNGELFADPAWDMLLDLMASKLERKRVAVSSLCIAAAVPATTALRWIKLMTDNGLFRRVADPTDGRRIFIELSENAFAAMRAFFAESNRLSPFPA